MNAFEKTSSSISNEIHFHSYLKFGIASSLSGMGPENRLFSTFLFYEEQKEQQNKGKNHSTNFRTQN
jgi:hypothetical protein